MDYEKKYKKALERAATELETCGANENLRNMIYAIFPDELKESEDEKIRKEIIAFIKKRDRSGCDYDYDKWLAWLEKQDGKESDPRYENLKELLAADDIYQMSMNDEMTNKAKWMAAKALSELCIGELLGFEKQGEQKPKDGYTFKSIPRLLEMIKPTDRAKAYCQKLIDSLLQEGYVTDAKIVSDCLKQMNGEKVAMATMDEQKPTSDIRWYEVGADGSLIIVNGKPFDYEHATITQKDFACDAEEASYTAEVATGDGSIKTVVSKKVSLPNPQSKEWSEEDEEMTKELIGGFLSSVSPYRLTHTSKEIVDWLDSVKCRMKGKEE